MLAHVQSKNLAFRFLFFLDITPRFIEFLDLVRLRITVNSYNKTKQILQFIFGIKLYMFRTVPLSIIRSFSLYTQQYYMSYRFADNLRAGSGLNSVLILLASCQQTCMTYTITVCGVKNS